MFAILPPLTLAMLLVAVWRRLRGHDDALLEAALIALTLWGALVALLTESLGALHALTAMNVTLAWATLTLVAAIWARPWRREDGGLAIDAALRPWMIALCILTSILLTTALLAPPNDHDAMVYHLARIIHWMQNRDVSFYPTNIRRQLHQGPLTEYAILQFFLTGGSDRFADAVQWAAYCGAVLAAARIARQIAADRRGQIFAAVIAATIPIGVLEASSAQNDLVLSLWILAAASFALDAMREKTPRYFALFGLAAGLAILTKATAYILLAPLLAWLLLSLLRAKAFRRVCIAAALITFLVIAINFPQYLRNARLYGSPIGASAEADNGDQDAYANAIFTPRALASNVIRNIGIELGTPISSACAGVVDAVAALHRLIGIDVNDPRTTWSQVTFNLVPQAWRNNNLASNPMHLVLLLAAFVSLAVARRRAPAPAMQLAACVVASFLLFCFYLRWQPWHTRQHLPMFMLAAAPIAVAVQRLWNPFLCRVALCLLLANALAVALGNEFHPWFGPTSIFTRSRADQYFYGLGSYRDPLLRIGQISRQFQARQVGLQCDLDAPEYLLWISLGGFDRNGLTLQHVDVTNPSKDLPQAIPAADFHPHLVVHIKTQTNYIGADVQ